MLIIESTTVNKFWVCGPISFKHMSFCCPFLDLHRTRHHSNIGTPIKISDWTRPPFTLLHCHSCQHILKPTLLMWNPSRKQSFCWGCLLQIIDYKYWWYSAGYVVYNFVLGAYAYWGPKAGQAIFNMVCFCLRTSNMFTPIDRFDIS